MTKPLLLVPGLLAALAFGMPSDLVHLGLLWVKIQATAVEIDRCLEVLPIAISAHTPLD
jgi:hypothetical protein